MTHSSTADGSTTHGWWSRWWYLIFLLGLLGQPVFDPSAGAVDWVVAVAVVAGFVLFAVLIDHGPAWVGERSPEIATVIGLLVVPLNVGAPVLLVYAASFAGTHRPRHTAYRWMVGLSVLVVAAFVFGLLRDPSLWPFATPNYGFSLVLVWVIGWISIEDVERERAEVQLRVDNARIEHLATMSERERIARDLHDLLGHTLTSIVVRAQLVQRVAASDPDRAVAEASHLEAAARDALDQVRGTLQGWRQADLDEEVTAAADALAAAGVDLVVDRDPDLTLAPSIEAALALGLRETVTNVVRHAHARRCVVTIAREDGEVVLRVRDDGRGGAAPDGGGLTGMRERMGALGGRVERDARSGTSVTIAVPAEVAG